MASIPVQVFLASCLSLLAHSAPAPAPQNQVHDYHTFRSDAAAVASGTPTAIAFPGATGSLYGDTNLVGYDPAHSQPTDTASSVVNPSDYKLAPGQSAPASEDIYIDFNGVDNFQPIRGGTDAPTDPGPRTPAYERLNSDSYTPPTSDSGAVPNAKWPLGLSHNRHGSTASAGWARQENVDVLPAATAMAGVDMRLSPHAYRELHWHQSNEWSYIMRGSARVASVNDAGESFIDDLQEGDVWFFPSGMPHSIQALDQGVEFLLIFDDGTFSESGTSLISETMLRMPREVLAKNFRTSLNSFENLPQDELYIFPGHPAPKDINAQRTVGPAGEIPKNKSYSYHLSQQPAFKVPGGSIKILDSATFPIASNFAAALVTLEPGAMREMHWHPTSDEWNYFLAGQARVSAMLPPSSSNTWDFSAGDVGYIPATEVHYIENTGDESVVFIEALLAPRFTDVSVGQWLGLTPRQVVEDHVKLPEGVMDNLPKVKPYIMPGMQDGKADNLRTDYRGEGL